MNNSFNKIICADVLEGLKQVPDDSVSLIVTSPPYNLKIDYKNREDNQPYTEYLNWLKQIFLECNRTLKQGGRLAINIDAMTNRQDDKDQEYVRCIYAHLYNMMNEIGLLFRTEICWYKQNAVGRATAWGSYLSCSNPCIRRNHEYILVWSKGQWQLEGDSELSDMTKDEFHQWTLSTWFISPETRNRGNHPVPYPEELVRRLVKLFSYRNDSILDPFNGSGTTTAVAASLMRRYIGIDNVKEYCEYAERRTAKALSDQKQLEIMDSYEPRSVRMQNEPSVEKIDEISILGIAKEEK